MLSKDLEESLNEAFKEARSKGHEFMTVEHLLLALLKNEISLNVLNKVGANVEKLSADLSEYIGSTTPNKKVETGSSDTSPTLGCCNEPSFMFSPLVGKRSLARISLLLSLVSTKAKRSFYLNHKISRGSIS